MGPLGRLLTDRSRVTGATAFEKWLVTTSRAEQRFGDFEGSKVET
jgi:hypothetical protein